MKYLLRMLSLNSSITSFVATSICLLIDTAFFPLSKWLNPKEIMSLANKVEVVVPSPALSAVLIAACLINSVPNASLGSFNEKRFSYCNSIFS